MLLPNDSQSLNKNEILFLEYFLDLGLAEKMTSKGVTSKEDYDN